MPLQDQRYTARLPLPDLIVRGVNHTVKCEVYLDGAADTLASATVSVYNASNTAVVDAAVATVAGGVASYTITAATTTGQTLGSKWRVEWAITLSTGAVIYPRNSAALVRNGLWPVIADVDLVRRVSSLDTTSSTVITSAADYQDYIDEAWTEIQLRLIGLGNRPNLIMEPSALRQPHLLLSLALVFEDLATRLNPAYMEQAASFRAQYDDAFRALNPEYDHSDSGQPDARRRPVVPTVWLCGGRDRGIY